MKNRISQRRFAVITGISIVVMTIAAGLSMGIVFDPVFEMNAEKFVMELPTTRTAFLLGTLGWVVILICDIIASWGLYKFYAKKNKSKSIVMGLLRLFYSTILLVAIIQLLAAFTSLYGAKTDSLAAYYHLQNFQSIWQLGLIIFGVHLIYVAQLVCEKKMILKVISVLLFIAGIGYVISNTADLIIADYEEVRMKVEAVFILPMVLGEFGLAIWLLVKGGREVRAQK